MAKVTGPLYSLGASGKIADAMVHFPWKGLNVVRQWLKPANPMTAKQGNVRLVLGGCGRSTKPIAEGSYFITQSRLLATGGQTWVSTIINYLILTKFPDPILTTFEAIYSAYAAHGAKTEFDTKAALLGLVDFDVSYKSTTHKFVAGMQLYCLALFATGEHTIDTTKFNKSPYTIAIGSWVSGNVDSMVTDMAA